MIIPEMYKMCEVLELLSYESVTILHPSLKKSWLLWSRVAISRAYSWCQFVTDCSVHGHGLFMFIERVQNWTTFDHVLTWWTVKECLIVAPTHSDLLSVGKDDFATWWVLDDTACQCWGCVSDVRSLNDDKTRSCHICQQLSLSDSIILMQDCCYFTQRNCTESW